MANMALIIKNKSCCYVAQYHLVPAINNFTYIALHLVVTKFTCFTVKYPNKIILQTLLYKQIDSNENSDKQVVTVSDVIANKTF